MTNTRSYDSDRFGGQSGFGFFLELLLDLQCR